MPLIPAPPAAPEKATVSLRVERGLFDQLTAYATFIGSSKEYIVSSALRRVFRHDKEFAAWLEARTSPREASRVTPAAPGASHQPEKEQATLSMNADARLSSGARRP